MEHTIVFKYHNMLLDPVSINCPPKAVESMKVQMSRDINSNCVETMLLKSSVKWYRRMWAELWEEVVE